MLLLASDFACKCGCKMPKDVTRSVVLVIERIELVKDELWTQLCGASFDVHLLSGYRCEAYNRKVGGARNSQHKLGKAGDFAVTGATVAQLFEAAKVVRGDASPEHPQRGGGIGYYPKRRFVHIDVREARVTWTG